MVHSPNVTMPEEARKEIAKAPDAFRKEAERLLDGIVTNSPRVRPQPSMGRSQVDPARRRHSRPGRQRLVDPRTGRVFAFSAHPAPHRSTRSDSRRG